VCASAKDIRMNSNLIQLWVQARVYTDSAEWQIRFYN
jgi:hypothetical protein